MTFAELVNDDIADVFIDTEVFGEAVEYHPAAGGGKRTIDACLVESPAATFDKEQFHEVKRETVTLLFKRSDTDGITEAKRGDHIVYLGKKWDFFRPVKRGTDVIKYLVLEWVQSEVINSGKVNIGL